MDSSFAMFADLASIFPSGVIGTEDIDKNPIPAATPALSTVLNMSSDFAMGTSNLPKSLEISMDAVQHALETPSPVDAKMRKQPKKAPRKKKADMDALEASQNMSILQGMFSNNDSCVISSLMSDILNKLDPPKPKKRTRGPNKNPRVKKAKLDESLDVSRDLEVSRDDAKPQLSLPMNIQSPQELLKNWNLGQFVLGLPFQLVNPNQPSLNSLIQMATERTKIFNQLTDISSPKYDPSLGMNKIRGYFPDIKTPDWQERLKLVQDCQKYEETGIPQFNKPNPSSGDIMGWYENFNQLIKAKAQAEATKRTPVVAAPTPSNPQMELMKFMQSQSQVQPSTSSAPQPPVSHMSPLDLLMQCAGVLGLNAQTQPSAPQAPQTPKPAQLMAQMIQAGLSTSLGVQTQQFSPQIPQIPQPAQNAFSVQNFLPPTFKLPTPPCTSSGSLTPSTVALHADSASDTSSPPI
ncbi:hypothetical protein L5515_015261 [Caenorhabditis briggsae]|uniref:Uncharacterized protein n=2 Tax=Caenorhabditis briggsae TaxID=6238 RepID=A0AAE9J9R9_CAEBR|nr:hypothetical protein L5515_015261 [Caenorhabditis briggsae]